ncbi:M20/M25/M40 family metallo-hydrolase [Streptomyces sp. B-S-A8]|uniref:M20/M25/M40 family metallo-hydrolase n=1 Tax=Streptomyces solicavernae TaxID=3043614 RepID=A0ABT6RZN0_9ACTN|nr:M20/M25/M40 family metallo-hydrolase [Streptomyces sp. B-S-A8]MDI3389897.1 M20/M25/M40 family metallo-hydrolase [Streptomyces sp. B-S-A8]
MAERTLAATALPYPPPPQARLTPADRDLLLRLLATPTVGPLEAGGDTEPVRLWDAGRQLAAAARQFGMTVVRHAAAPDDVLAREGVPVSVRECAAVTPGFLDCQPSLLLRLGPGGLPRRDTVMFNVHLDTVGGWWPPSFDGTRFSGRGAIDAKGPAVALLAGIRAACAAEPALGSRIGVLVQAVAGEEGGAMGTFGTRPLVEQGHTGRLNVFCEPTGHRWLPRATAAMTACVQVHGDDAIDDRPEAGHNATVLLGHLAHHLATALPARARGAQVCVAGLHTGHQHNKVYGSGRLLLNIAYPDPSCGRAAEAALHESVAEGIAAFRAGARRRPALARTAEDAAAITSVRWLKRGLPALNGPMEDGSWAESLLEADCGLTRWPAHEPAFTCDALWMSGVPGTYTAVFGPGSLDANRAHADGEYADLAELDRYATEVARILVAFARRADPVDAAPEPTTS